jgi:thiol-disulfide isomerase/thioredoxin
MRFLPLFCIAALLAPIGASRSTAEIIGQSVPRAVSEDQMKASLHQIKLVDENGATLDLGALLANGKPTLITLWAHWCPNCQAETRGLKTLADACPSKWNLVFVSSRFGDYARDLAKFKSFGLPWKLYNVSRDMMETPNKYAILRAFSGATTDGAVITPLHYILSSKGSVQAIVNGRVDFSAPQRVAAFCRD